MTMNINYNSTAGETEISRHPGRRTKRQMGLNSADAELCEIELWDQNGELIWIQVSFS